MMPDTPTQIPDDLLTKMKEHFNRHVRNQPVSARIRKLKTLRRWIWTHRSQLVQALKDDFDKPALETELSETKVVLAEIDHALRHIRHWVDEKRVATPLTLFGGRSRIRMEPKGVVLIIAPWNFPFNLSVGPLVSAIAAGNGAIVKPSEYTPRTSALIAQMAKELFHPHELTVVQGGVETAQQLTRLPFDHIFFTGSPQVGKKVMAAAAENLTPVTLELGGQNPVIVDETAVIEQAARRILYAKILNAGQSCVSANYVFVHVSRKEALLSAMENEAKKMTQGGEKMAAIINKNHAGRLSSWLREARENGARLYGVHSADDNERRLPPQIIEQPPPNGKLLNNEIFGPLLPLLTYTDIESVIKHINERPNPLALYIFSTRRTHIQRIIRETHSGAVGVNETTVHFFNNNLPFGGAGYSGIGNAHGYYGFRAFSRERAVFRMPARFSIVDLIRPPYTRLKSMVAEIILRYL